MALQLSFMSHSRTVRSQDELARTACTGLKLRQLTGPWWPPRTYRGRRTMSGPNGRGKEKVRC